MQWEGPLGSVAAAVKNRQNSQFFSAAATLPSGPPFHFFAADSVCLEIGEDTDFFGLCRAHWPDYHFKCSNEHREWNNLLQMYWRLWKNLQFGDWECKDNNLVSQQIHGLSSRQNHLLCHHFQWIGDFISWICLVENCGAIWKSLRYVGSKCIWNQEKVTNLTFHQNHT